MALYGRQYLPADTPVHPDPLEAVRPTNVPLHPGLLGLKEYTALTLSLDAERLYARIWYRFIASQMRPARCTSVTVTVRPYWPHSVKQAEQQPDYPCAFVLEASTCEAFGSHMLLNRAAGDSGAATMLPALHEGDTLVLKQIVAQEQRTEPLPCYTPAALLADLALLGIEPPERWAETVDSLREAGFVVLENGELAPTPLGEDVLSVCLSQCPGLFSPQGLAATAIALDAVARGALGREQALQAFYGRLVSPPNGQAAPDATDEPEVRKEMAG